MILNPQLSAESISEWFPGESHGSIISTNFEKLPAPNFHLGNETASLMSVNSTQRTSWLSYFDIVSKKAPF